MKEHVDFYIGGQWVAPVGSSSLDVVNPANEEVAGRIRLGCAADVDRAVDAARRAFETYSQTTTPERLALLDRIIAAYEARWEDLAQAMTLEMGAPITFSREVQTRMAFNHFKQIRRILADYEFEKIIDGVSVRREPIGVCGLITPWNWPLNQITAKLAPVLAAGCTSVVKPSEVAPLSSNILMEILHEAQTPAGVVNLVQGDGSTVGEAIAAHPGIDMVSFTGSTRAGVAVARAAAASVKRVTQELGGKSPNVILPDAELARAIPDGVLRAFMNTGQSCIAPTRMIAPRSMRDAVVTLAKQTAESVVLGDPNDPSTKMGPLVSAAQFERVQNYIQLGIDEGATLVCGGIGRPDSQNRGYFVRPTVFCDVTSKMTIAREEIFGPVLAIQLYDTEDEAISIANDTDYGLAAYVYSSDLARAHRVGTKLRAGRVFLNGALADQSVPFGGYKKSGNGREQGLFGLEEYLEVKAMISP